MNEAFNSGNLNTKKLMAHPTPLNVGTVNKSNSATPASQKHANVVHNPAKSPIEDLKNSSTLNNQLINKTELNKSQPQKSHPVELKNTANAKQN